MRLKDKVAIVTGAASGIGKEIATAFAREGAKVVIADLNQKAADAAAAELGDARKAIGVVMDVTNEQQVEAGVARTVEQFGKVDVLVSNAGIQIVAPLDEFKFADWKKLLSIHLDGAFLTTRAVLQQMYKQGSGGSIIYMGSVHSKEASVLKGPYVTAKHGLIGLAKVVAKEGAKHGVRAHRNRNPDVATQKAFLRFGRTRRAQFPPKCVRRGARPTRRPCERWSVLSMDYVIGRISLSARPSRRRQIGRASCRERV